MAIRFELSYFPNLLILHLGEYDASDDNINLDKQIKNGDRELILRTVMSSIFSILDKLPYCKIDISGNKTYKTRFFCQFIKEAQYNKRYGVSAYNLRSKVWESLTQDCSNYGRILIYRRRNGN